MNCVLLATEEAGGETGIRDPVDHPAGYRQPNPANLRHPMKKYLLLLLASALLGLGATTATASDTAPKSVIHVVTIAWKEGTSPEQIQAALDGAKALPAAYPGITHVWTKAIKVQNPPGTTVNRTHVIVMEFADEAALKAYTDSPAQKEWYKVYFSIRAQSTTHDITN